MLQPDEIIQQKEWHQLSADEKELLAELADNEAEYNLLKKMLMVSSEAVTEVPAVNEEVYRQIKSALPLTQKQPSRKYWYAAAAAVIVLILSVFFIFKQQDRGGYVVKPAAPVEVKPAVKEILPEKKDSSSLLVETTPVKKTGKGRRKVQPTFPSLQKDDPQQYVVVNSTVSGNTALLDLVTEVE
jgi:hypothetical protein